jgi:ERF superfamily
MVMTGELAEQPKSFAEAMAMLQAQLPTIGKGETVEVKNDAGKLLYKYTYASLAAYNQILNRAGRLGLAWITRPTITDHGFVLAYAMIHVTDDEGAGGEYPLPDPSRTDPKKVGSAITYARRYCLSAVTGLAPADDDDDAAEAHDTRTDEHQRTKTKVTGADHERLRRGAVEAVPEDIPAARGPAPADEDLWAGQPTGDFEPTPTTLPPRRPPMTKPQMIAAHFKRLGITDEEERHNWVAKMAGTEPGPTEKLPDEVQQTILSALGSARDIGKVQAWIDRRDQDAAAEQGDTP